MRRARILLLLFLLVALLPYLFTCFYALPFADDFCFGWTASEKISFAQKFLKQYLHWNGRYSSDVLVNFHPLICGSLLKYRLVSLFAILAFPFVHFVFIRSWLYNNFISAVAALFISLFYLCYQPNITEGVYWYIGIVNYHLGSLCFILQLIVLSRFLKSGGDRKIYLAISLSLLIAAVGFNEVAAALIPGYYFAALIYFKIYRMPTDEGAWSNRILIAHFAIALIASLFVICSPGNFTRENVFTDRFNLIHSVIFASLQTIRFIGLWSLSIPFLALSFIVVTKANQVKAGCIKSIDYRFLFVLLLFTVFIAAFLPYMATGILGQHRTMIYIMPYFIILWLATLLSASQKYQLYQKISPAITNFRMALLAFISVVVMGFSGNSRKIIGDARDGSFQLYQSEFMKRQGDILAHPNIAIRSIEKTPKTFDVVDVKNDTTWWVDKCMKRYYTETKLILK